MADKKERYLRECHTETTEGENAALWLFLNYNVSPQNWSHGELKVLADALWVHGDRRNPLRDESYPIWDETIWYEQAILLYAELEDWATVESLLKTREFSREWKSSGVTFFLHRMANRAETKWRTG